MEDTDRNWLQRELDVIKEGQKHTNALIEAKPCALHGEELATIKQSLSNGTTFRDKAWKRVLSLGVLMIGAAGLALAYLELKK